ncbi:MAG: YbaK/EbsC family protein [Pseudomonadota bacterium]|nr:YbaK/EbsC family protein [Pseudomonadota bacterium]
MAIAPSIERYLKECNVRYELIEHHRTGSTHESALAAHIRDDHIAKAVMVSDEEGDAMVVVPGDSWLDLDALNQETSRGFRLDDESELTELLSDCAEGAVPPLGPAYGLETFLDEALTTLANVYFEAGDHQHLVHVSGEDFTGLLSGVRHGHFSREN